MAALDANDDQVRLSSLKKSRKEVDYYHSVDHIFNNCGEVSMEPSKFWIYKLFEPGLEKSTTITPCADREYTEYKNTPTHGFGPLKMRFDIYAHKK